MSIKKVILVSLSAYLSLFLFLYLPMKAYSLSRSDWQSGNIISDSLFYNGNAMSVGEIQAFLNALVPECDTWGTKMYNSTQTRAQYGTSKGNPPPYICVRNYYENPTTHATNFNPTASIPDGAISAAQIINNAAKTYNINPKVLLVTLKKEAAANLIADDWPWTSQYRVPMGYGCPDTAPCNEEYYGFYNQIDTAAWQFRRYVDTPNNYRHQAGQIENIGYNPNGGCGSSNVLIQNYATAGLYNYTPYQPNQAALNNLYGTGDGCSAYGNRNFWVVWHTWFGSPYDSGPYLRRSKPNGELTPDTTLEPGDFISSPDGRFVTVMQMDGNLVTYRGKRPVWYTVTHGNYGAVAKFQSDGNFVIYRPDNTAIWHTHTNGSGANKLMLKDDGNIYINENSTRKYATNFKVSPSATSQIGTQITSGTILSPGEYLQSSDSRYQLAMQTDGNLVLYGADGTVLWHAGTNRNPGAFAAMQSDGNLVIYNPNGKPLWGSGSSGSSTVLKLQTDGNLVIYNDISKALWHTKSYQNNYRMKLRSGTQITSGNRLEPTEYIISSDWRYRLIMQVDGNLVLYSVNNYRPLWNSRTMGNPGAYAVMQGDGHLVVYSASGKPLWGSGTAGKGASSLSLQNDGNVVVYTSSGQPAWASQTNGQF